MKAETEVAMGDCKNEKGSCCLYEAEKRMGSIITSIFDKEEVERLIPATARYGKFLKCSFESDYHEYLFCLLVMQVEEEWKV